MHRSRTSSPFLRTAMLTCVCLAALASAGAPRATAAPAKADKRPNILFIMSDDHGYQAMSCYGSRVNKTPQLDRIAKGGMRFDRCFVTNSICGPSRAVILTGKYSHLNGFVRNGNTFNGAQPTVAKLLQAAGYQTAVVGKWHLRSTPTGFDYYHVLIGQGPYYNPPMLTSTGRVQHTGYTTDIITDVALDWLKNKRQPGKPFFLVYQHKAPHRNWQPGPKYLNKYDDVTIPEPETLFDDYKGRGTAAKTQRMMVARDLNPNDLKLTKPRRFTPEQLAAWNKAYGPKNKAFAEAKLEGKELIRWKYQRYVKDYLRCVDAVDENVGRVLDYLDETGLAKNTVVFYTSDQGWYLGEHGWFDKRWMYEESFRTPLLVRWPGKTAAGSVNQDLVMNLDFAETFLDIAGVPIPPEMQGRSLKSILEGNTPKDWRDSVYYHYYEYPGAHSVRRHYGVRNRRYKLIYFYRIDEWELYDLQKDPHELQSVYADPQYAAVVKEMKAELDRLRKKYGDDGDVVDFGAQRARKVKLQQVGSFDFKKLSDSGRLKGKLAAGLHGAAIELQGEGPALNRPSSKALNPAYKPITIGGWIKSETGRGVIAAQGGESLGYALYLQNGSPQFAVRNSGVLKRVRGKRIAQGQWVHVTAVLGKDGMGQIYINGEPSGRSRQLGFISGQPADGFSLGADSGSLVGNYEADNGFRGQLEDIRVYWGVLPPEQLREWAQKPK